MSLSRWSAMLVPAVSLHYHTASGGGVT